MQNLNNNKLFYEMIYFFCFDWELRLYLDKEDTTHPFF